MRIAPAHIWLIASGALLGVVIGRHLAEREFARSAWYERVIYT